MTQTHAQPERGPLEQALGVQTEATLLTALDRSQLPKHVAIIMDGNGRWAADRHLPRIMGHHRGIDAVREVVTVAREVGIETLTLYAFSYENWRRPATEIGQLMLLLETYLKKEVRMMVKNGIRFLAIGRRESLPPPIVKLIRRVEEMTSRQKEMTLIVALSYGGRAEIVDAANKLVQSVVKKYRAGDPVPTVDEALFSVCLYTGGVRDPDLMIRTSGELRISNFFLWQMAYTELYFTKVRWPDFKRKDFLLALLDYQDRERRFGLVSKPTSSAHGPTGRTKKQI